MFRKLEYDDAVRWLNRAVVAVSALLVLSAFLPSQAAAQINGAPPSVTSMGFGGRAINGTRPSVTSLGPLGPTFNPAFPNSRPLFGHHHHHGNGNGFVPWGWGVGYYAIPYDGYYDQDDDAAADDPPQEQYNGGPTIFDRRGSGRVPRPPQSDYVEHAPQESASVASEPAAAPVPDQPQPQTVLVFKDGHQQEVENYAIVGDTLYDLSEGRRHKIPLSDLDLDSTVKQNDQRGIDFQVPAGS